MSRIISGRFRGRRIIAPKKIDVRPTTDRAKEALFNILRSQIDLEKTEVLDLFAGIGTISLEFISRSCPLVLSVDANPKAVDFIRSFSVAIGAEGLELVCGKAESFLERNFRKFDLVFADPPYDYGNYEVLVDQIRRRALRDSDSLLVIEHGEEADLSSMAGYRTSRTYGRVIFSFFDPPERK